MEGKDREKKKVIEFEIVAPNVKCEVTPGRKGRKSKSNKIFGPKNPCRLPARVIKRAFPTNYIKHAIITRVPTDHGYKVRGTGG